MGAASRILFFMPNDAVAQGIEQNKALKKEMLDRHRPAFNLWFRVAQLLEEPVVKDRTQDSAFSRAPDLFFSKLLSPTNPFIHYVFWGMERTPPRLPVAYLRLLSKWVICALKN